jgi:hypothetical protein
MGISWTALFLAHGLDVTVCDPLPDVAERVRAGLREIAPTLTQLGLPVDELTDSTDALRFDPDAASAVAGTDVVPGERPRTARGHQGDRRAVRLVTAMRRSACDGRSTHRRCVMLKRINAALGRLRPHRRRSRERGWYSQADAQRYRADRVGEIARGLSLQPPGGPHGL